MGRSAASLAQPMQFAVAEIVPAAIQTELLQNSPTGQPDSRNAMAMAISVAAQRADRPSYGFRGSATFGVRFGGSLVSHEASQLKIRFVPFELMVRVASRRRAHILLSTHANVN
jgi:hypothetical protein